eukprot:460569-Pyramimonas_sp.AAC.1
MGASSGWFSRAIASCAQPTLRRSFHRRPPRVRARACPPQPVGEGESARAGNVLSFCPILRSSRAR